MKLPSSCGQIVNIWSGGMGNILKDGRGVIYACGLNNYGQLGEISSSYVQMCVIVSLHW